MTGERWWPVAWDNSDQLESGEGWIPAITLTHWHPTVKRAMRDSMGVVLEFHARLGKPPLHLGVIDDLELRCVLMDLAAKWMRSDDDGERE